MSTTTRLELTDAYVHEWETEGIVKDAEITLAMSAFFPGGGGQVPDRGRIFWEGGSADVDDVKEVDGQIVVSVTQSPPDATTTFLCHLDVPRRIGAMRSHTAFHVLASVLCQDGALVTGCQLTPEGGRGDFTAASADSARAAVIKTNAILAQGVPVVVEWISREEFMNSPELVRLADGQVPSVDPVRIVHILGVDRQADGGTHVSNTAECGQIRFQKFESKGSRNKRVTFSML